MTGDGTAGGRRVLIHLGMPKTGTTALQNALDRLTPGEAPGVIYPAFGREGRVAHHPLAEQLRAHLAAGGDPEMHAQRVVTDLLQDGRFRDGVTAIYSSEAFTNLCGHSTAGALGRWIDALRAAGRVEAVIYLREMTSFVESMFLQSSRYGHVAEDFSQYVPPRLAWFRNVSQGLKVLQEHGVEVACATPGYDILDEFDRRLALSAGTLRAACPADSTAKLGHKAQTVLANLKRVGQKVGFPIDRRAMIRLLADTGGIPGDAVAYSLFTPAKRRRAKADFDAVAQECGLQAYVSAFADRAPAAAPFLPLRLPMVDQAALDWLAAHRDRLAPSERPKRAGRKGGKGQDKGALPDSAAGPSGAEAG